MNKGGNCGCRVGDSKDCGVSLSGSLLAAIVAITSITSIAGNMDYCRFTGHCSNGTGNMFSCSMGNGKTNSGCVVKTISKTITKTKTIRMNKRGNCGCRVGDGKDSGVSLS